MKQFDRLGLIGNSLPRRCGIATFTTHLHQAISAASPCTDVRIVAMSDSGRDYDYPEAVHMQVADDRIEDYRRAADMLNAGRCEVVCLQHEFGIFGGEAGSHVIALLSGLAMPVVTTLHTVLAEPSPAQRAVMDRIVDLSARIVVMAEKGRELLRTVYRVPPERIDVIPHGIPNAPFVHPDEAKARLGFAGRAVILTFGLLSPNKGIEVMIDAMPLILKSRPDAVYVVLGATHPNLVRDQGEAYRDSLVDRVRQLGIDDHVVFLDQFVDLPTLLGFISMCDVYVTPYLREAQMTSGTLAYSFGMGKPVISTPYWHARELLADDRGVLVPFGDADALGAAIAGLLTDDAKREAMSARAYAFSRSMTWERTAERYLATFESARLGHRLRVVARSGDGRGRRQDQPPPEMRTDHLLTMCDDTGLFQHAAHSVPDRAHGYCVDDNARALLLACALNRPGETGLSDALTARLAAFVQHAWNPDAGRFRNFMSFDRRWLEDRGSEDSHGRTLWALGACALGDASSSRRRWAAGLMAEALPAVEGFRSPRAWAFALLGLNAFCAAVPGDGFAADMRGVLADRLLAIFRGVQTGDWVWFEQGLAYDNARLCQAMIGTGLSTGTNAYVDAGLRSLRWLVAVQTAPSGVFRPVGSASFGDTRIAPEPFDQQPLEAAATISACLAAWEADGNPAWEKEAIRAFAWFLGENDLSVPIVDVHTGSCRDGLHPDRANENCGGESVVSYLLSLAEIRQLSGMSGRDAPAAPWLLCASDIAE
ncbi:MAG: glycosyltransferase family 4 protein [Proteobacteria bacterium]|nr:glycosyltransferase family 4 protein [Pseudomonadota bacterium]